MQLSFDEDDDWIREELLVLDLDHDADEVLVVGPLVSDEVTRLHGLCFPHVGNLHNELLATAFVEDSERLSIAVRNLELDIQLHVSSEEASIKTFNESLYLRVRLLFHTDEPFSKSRFGQRSFPVTCSVSNIIMGLLQEWKGVPLLLLKGPRQGAWK